jgi:SSS family solute:Na+ symporter
MIATVMSTIDSYAFIAATTVGRDLIWRLRGERPSDAQPALSRIGLWTAAAFATALALARQSVIALWHDVGSVVTSTLLLPVGLALLGHGRLRPRPTLALMLIPFAVSLGWVLAKPLSPVPGADYPWSIEPIYAGLGASILTWLAGLAFQHRETRA